MRVHFSCQMKSYSKEKRKKKGRRKRKKERGRRSKWFSYDRAINTHSGYIEGWEKEKPSIAVVTRLRHTRFRLNLSCRSSSFLLHAFDSTPQLTGLMQYLCSNHWKEKCFRADFNEYDPIYWIMYFDVRFFFSLLFFFFFHRVLIARLWRK